MAERDKSKKDARITIRLTKAQEVDLRAAAERRDRTLNSLSRHILTSWLAQERRRRKK